MDEERMIAEILFDAVYRQELELLDYYEETREQYERKGRRVKWTTDDGRQLAVIEMSDHHVRTSLNMLLRNGLEDCPWVSIFEKELAMRESETL